MGEAEGDAGGTGGSSEKNGEAVALDWDQEFGSLRPRITLYKAHHQFADNLRAHRINASAIAIAAMMGIIPTAQQTHYGWGAHGKIGQGITQPEVSASLMAQGGNHPPSSKLMVIQRSLISIVAMDQTGSWGVDLWRMRSPVVVTIR